MGVCLILSDPAFADIDVAEYQLQRSVRSETERRRLQAEFERRREAAAQEENRVQEALAQAQAEEAARRAARPYPVRLTEARCTRCHVPAHYTTKAYGMPGWAAVVLRMRLLNDADDLAWEEMSVIIGHLARTHPATAIRHMMEWITVGLLLVLPLWLRAWLRSHRPHPSGTTKAPRA